MDELWRQGIDVFIDEELSSNNNKNDENSGEQRELTKDLALKLYFFKVIYSINFENKP